MLEFLTGPEAKEASVYLQHKNFTNSQRGKTLERNLSTSHLYSSAEVHNKHIKMFVKLLSRVYSDFHGSTT
jgi:hypothetical protein